MATKYKDVVGQKFTRLTAVKYIGSSKDGDAIWLCQCSCGKSHSVLGKNLRRGHAKSCGCLVYEGQPKHGLYKHPLYKTWENIKSRCHNPNATGYLYYGGRGITVCSEWLNNPDKFISWAVDNGWSKGLTIDRIDNNGDYSPDNCRWVTMAVQNTNKRARTETNRPRFDKPYKGRKLPVGVYRHKQRFRAIINIGGKLRHIGVYENAEEASKAFEEYKSKLEK